MTNAQPSEGLGAVEDINDCFGGHADVNTATGSGASERHAHQSAPGPFSRLQWCILSALAVGKLNAWDSYRDLRVSCLRTHVSHLERRGVLVCRERFDMPTQFLCRTVRKENR